MVNPININKLNLIYDVDLKKKEKRINLKVEHELSCFIACHLGEIESLHKLMKPH